MKTGIKNNCYVAVIAILIILLLLNLYKKREYKKLLMIKDLPNYGDIIRKNVNKAGFKNDIENNDFILIFYCYVTDKQDYLLINDICKIHEKCTEDCIVFD